MLWNWYTVDSCFIASSWHVTSRGAFAGSCIGVVLLVLLLELLQRSLERRRVGVQGAQCAQAGKDVGDVRQQRCETCQDRSELLLVGSRSGGGRSVLRRVRTGRSSRVEGLFALTGLVLGVCGREAVKVREKQLEATGYVVYMSGLRQDSKLGIEPR